MKKTKKRTKYLLLLLILFISVGYAILQSNLTITGTTSIQDSKWDIHWNNVQVTSGSVTGDNVTTPATIDSTKTTVSYSITLDKPGDFYEFTVDAVNAGTIDGMIDTISSKLNGTEITTLPAYLEYNVTYSDDVKVEANQKLLHGTTETYKVTVRFKRNIYQEDLPDTAQNLNFQFTIVYKQADSNSIEVPHPTYVYTANLGYFSDGRIDIGQPIPNGITQYSTASEALAAIRAASGVNDLPFYLKQGIRDGIVVESFVEFVVTPEMIQANPGMTAGTYAIKVIKNGPTNIMTGEESLLIAFGNGRCNITDNRYVFCNVPELNAYFGPYGFSVSNNNGWECIIQYSQTYCGYFGS